MTLARATIDQLIADVGADAAPRLIRLFLRESREQAAGIGPALESGRMREAGRLAHSLKQSARGFGLPDLGQRAQILQEIIDAGDEARAEEALAALRQAMPQELAELETLLDGFPAP
jgi:HPt (histidine-containing phosphotransfer) domain-containing protein